MKDNINMCVFVSIRKIFGGKWRLPVLWHISQGNNRFSMLKNNIETLSEKMLYTELRELEELGFITKEVLSEKPQKTVVYHINEDKQRLVEVVDELYKLMYNELEEIDFNVKELFSS